ncbi:hypothetical protein [Parvularcula maris]|uniref:Haem-binding uptake Tiki superfamily ChaN domain-containing protein n=1 Tax=Parvularcula maris TaxID=2965077 RepID=A0A9X2L7S0_9PROT|nr:hypothetical protein [Parvularcula maris]MCQ8184511.1 hypothetical protein [Parvularcula maris]
MRLWMGIAGLSVLLSACATTEDRSASACNAPDGWQEVAEAAEGQFLLFGESHGTEEIPDLFESYVCAVSARGGRTLVGLEFQPGDAAAVEAALASEDPGAAIKEAMAPTWRLYASDGRGSEAMLGLLLALDKMDGVDLVFFDDFDVMRDLNGPVDAPQEEVVAWYQNLPPHALQRVRDARMAEELDAAFTDDYDRAVVLVGSIHASKTRFDFLGDTDNAAMLLPEGTVTLVSMTSGGEAWVNGGVKPVRQSRLLPEGATAPSITLVEGGVDEGRFDGYYFVGEVTASPPVVQE